MVASGFADRHVLGATANPITGSEFARRIRSGAAALNSRSALVYAGENHALLPIAMLSAAWAGIPFVPVNYRLEDGQLNSLTERQPDALVLADAATAPRITSRSVGVLPEWLAQTSIDDAVIDPAGDDDAVAVVIYTSGTTSEPKSALLRHRHLMAYLLGSVEFGGADSDEAVLVAVPPYHIAGIANMLSNLFAGRRLVYLSAFEPSAWLNTVRDECITHAMVVPTMLTRIVGAVEGRTAETPSLGSLSYGGAKITESVLLKALSVFPETDFVNAYGLTETASTIAVLGPAEHREAAASNDPSVRRRLMSAGRVLPTVEIEVREDGIVVPVGRSGLIYVRGEQIAGEYSTGSALDAEGWFCTRDRGHIDSDGYLFVEGRADDTIIRGGENIAPAEIEDVLLRHPAVAEVCVVGLPDPEWGHRIAAVVVRRDRAEVDVPELQDFVRERLRGARTPEVVTFRESLPHTETGKLLRRVVLDELMTQAETGP